MARAQGMFRAAFFAAGTYARRSLGSKMSNDGFAPIRESVSVSRTLAGQIERCTFFFAGKKYFASHLYTPS